MKSKRQRRQAEQAKLQKRQELVEHFRSRFFSRHGIEVTREIRLDILKQIRSGSAVMTYQRENSQWWRVNVLGKPYTVIYGAVSHDLVTVLPKENSEEFKEFCQRAKSAAHVKKREVIARRLTHDERRKATREWKEQDMKSRERRIRDRVRKKKDLGFSEEMFKTLDHLVLS